MASLYLIHGFIGYGKTTFAKKLVKDTGAVKFTHDEWMIDFYGTNPPIENFQNYCTTINNKIIEMTKEFIKRDIDVILDFGFWSRKDRDNYRDLAKSLGAKVILYSINCDFETALERVKKRTEAMPEGAMFIDENAMHVLWKKFEPLQEDEERIIAEIEQ